MRRLSGSEEAEYVNLLATVTKLEALLSAGGELSPMVSASLSGYLATAKGRLQELEERDKELERQENQRQDLNNAAAKAQAEVALSARERAQYQSFLEQEYFTKADFSKLEKFYQSAWDKLSDDGKAEMSHRVWEGVRRKEYEFSELPDIVKQKEAERLYQALRSEEPTHQSLQNIKQQDREEFIEAWESGKRGEAYQILDRPSFAENVALSASSVKSNSIKVKTQVDAAKIIEQQTALTPVKEAKTSEGNAAGQAELKLDDLQLLDSGDSKVAAPLPELKGNGSSAKTVKTPGG